MSWIAPTENRKRVQPMPLHREKIAIKAPSSWLLKIEAAVFYGVSLGQTILNVRPRRDGSSPVTSPNHVHLSDSNAAELKNSHRTCMGTKHASTAIAWILQRPGTINSPGGYWRSVTQKVREGGFSINRLLFSKMKANQALGPA